MTADVHRRLRADEGSAIIEFVFAAVLMMVPVVYLVVTVATVQRSQLAVSSAARDAGRAFATADTVEHGLQRAQAAADIAWSDAHYDDEPVVRFVAADAASCTAPAQQPTLVAGAEFTVCVQRQLAPPAVPAITHFSPITVVGTFRLHIDDFRAAA